MEIELLAPAGNFSKLKTALYYGADAVYLGGKNFSLRAFSDNFTEEEFAKTRKAILESVGEPVEYTYLTTLELAALHPQIWKVRFKRWNVNRSKEYTSEILFKVITGMENKNQAVITGFHFL